MVEDSPETLSYYSSISGIFSSEKIYSGSGIASSCNHYRTNYPSYNRCFEKYAWYKINISTPSAIKIRTNTSNYTPYLFLYDQTGNSLSSGYDIKCHITVPGTYYIQVRSAFPYITSTRTGTASRYLCYKCQMNVPTYYVTYYSVRDFCNYQLDVTSETYQDVNFNAEKIGYLNSANDIDWYRISISERCKVSSLLYNDQNIRNYQLAVYDTNGIKKNSTLWGNSTHIRSTEILDPGTYFVEVYSPNTSYSTTIPYRLVVSKYIPDNYEMNDDYQNAKSINLNQEITGTIDNSLDEDWYKVNFSEAGVMDVGLDSLSRFGYGIDIYDANKALCKSSTDKGFMWDVNSPGYYYIKVYSKYGIDNSSASYNLKISKKEKLELSTTEVTGTKVTMCLKVNYAQSIKNAAIVLEYNNAYLTNPISTASAPLSNPSGLKTIAAKKIVGSSNNNVVFYYDMEDDFAEDLDNEDVIIDYIIFDKSSSVGPTTVSILPESYIGYYDSSKCTINKKLSTTLDTALVQQLSISPNTTLAQTTISENISGIKKASTSKSYKNDKSGITIYGRINDIHDALSEDFIKENPELVKKLKEKQQNVIEPQPITSLQTMPQLATINSNIDLYDQNSDSSISGVMRVPVGSSIKPEYLKVFITETATKDSTTPNRRYTYPDKVGRFTFDHVTAGINYTISVENTKPWTQSSGEHMVFNSIAKDIGSVNGSDTLFVQDLGYFYRFDFNSNGISNEPNEADGFFTEIVKEGVETGNYKDEIKLGISALTGVSSTTTTTLSSNQNLNLDKNSEVNIFDASSSISGGSWLDNPEDGSVDLNKYNAESVSNNIPSNVNTGTSGEFYISFLDTTSLWVTEDCVESILSPQKYYKLLRCDSESSFKITGINFFEKISGVGSDGKTHDGVKFKVSYSVPQNTGNKTITLKFRLANTTTLKNGFGKTLQKKITIIGQGTSTEQKVKLVIGGKVISSARIYNGVPVADFSDLAFALGDNVMGIPDVRDIISISYKRPNGGYGEVTYKQSELIHISDNEHWFPIIRMANDMQYGGQVYTFNDSNGSPGIYIDLYSLVQYVPPLIYSRFL